MNKAKLIAIGKRAAWTILQASASAAIVAIGSVKTMGEVNWGVVASTAALAGIFSLLKSIAVGIPEEG